VASFVFAARHSFRLIGRGSSMPLIATNRPMILIAQTPWAVGFWIHIVGSTPPDFVWVVATH
jgi:hypothetical protein